MAFFLKRCDSCHKVNERASSISLTVGMEMRKSIPRMEDDMRKVITVTVIVVVAMVTTAWAVSNQAITSKALGGGGAVPMHASLLW
jgi:hypothetical protein